MILLSESGERYTLDVQEAGAYQFRVTYNGKYYNTSYPVEIRDAADELVAELPTDGWGNIRDGIVTLAVGEYHLVLLPGQNNTRLFFAEFRVYYVKKDTARLGRITEGFEL